MDKNKLQFVAAFVLMLVLFIVVLTSIPRETGVSAQGATAVSESFAR